MDLRKPDVTPAVRYRQLMTELGAVGDQQQAAEKARAAEIAARLPQLAGQVREAERDLRDAEAVVDEAWTQAAEALCWETQVAPLGVRPAPNPNADPDQLPALLVQVRARSVELQRAVRSPIVPVTIAAVALLLLLAAWWWMW